MDGSTTMTITTMTPTTPAALERAPLTPKACAMVRGWLEQHRGDEESLARWMHRTFRLSTTAACRRMVREAVAEATDEATGP